MWPFSRLSLFWKIFLWFWGAMVLMITVSIVSWIMLRDSISFYPAHGEVKTIINKLAFILESDYPERRKRRLTHQLLRSFAPPPPVKRRQENTSFQPFYLLNQDGVLRSGNELPQAITALLNRSNNNLQVVTHDNYVYVGPKKVNVRGQTYQLFLSQYIGRFKGRMFLHLVRSVSLWQVVLYLILSGALCFVLAWSITRPIRQLQGVSKRIAAGESVSAVEKIAPRRDEFFQLAKDFDVMAEKILNTVNTQKQLLSDVSHELRSPLSRIQITLGLLDKKLGGNETELLDRLEKECSRMDGMIGQLLSIAALERGQVYEKEQSIDLGQLLTDIIEDASFEASEKQISIVSQLNGNATVTGYYGLLYSAVENIIRNALRYSPNQSEILVHLTVKNSSAIISISDSGPGVEQESLKKIFEPFYRTDSARSREKGGAGLGLAITSRAVNVHKGSIFAKRREPSGLTVVIELPITKA